MTVAVRLANRRNEEDLLAKDVSERGVSGGLEEEKLKSSRLLCSGSKLAVGDEVSNGRLAGGGGTVLNVEETGVGMKVGGAGNSATRSATNSGSSCSSCAECRERNGSLARFRGFPGSKGCSERRETLASLEKTVCGGDGGWSTVLELPLAGSALLMELVKSSLLILWKSSVSSSATALSLRTVFAKKVVGWKAVELRKPRRLWANLDCKSLLCVDVANQTSPCFFRTCCRATP